MRRIFLATTVAAGIGAGWITSADAQPTHPIIEKVWQRREPAPATPVPDQPVQPKPRPDTPPAARPDRPAPVVKSPDRPAPVVERPDPRPSTTVERGPVRVEYGTDRREERRRRVEDDLEDRRTYRPASRRVIEAEDERPASGRPYRIFGEPEPVRPIRTIHERSEERTYYRSTQRRVVSTPAPVVIEYPPVSRYATPRSVAPRHPIYDTAQPTYIYEPQPTGYYVGTRRVATYALSPNRTLPVPLLATGSYVPTTGQPCTAPYRKVAHARGVQCICPPGYVPYVAR